MVEVLEPPNKGAETAIQWCSDCWGDATTTWQRCGSHPEGGAAPAASVVGEAAFVADRAAAVDMQLQSFTAGKLW